MLLLVRRDWTPILARAAEIVESYSTGVTLRQLHYRLVSDPTLDYDNTQSDYKQLSSRTAELRRDDVFPSLLDQGRSLSIPLSFANAGEAVEEAAERFRLDRSRGQDPLPFVLLEKATLFEQVWRWVSRKGIPVSALRGYSSVTLDQEIERFVYSMEEEREVRVLYVGDFDPSGEDIERNFREQTVLDTTRIALRSEQVDEFDLPPAPGKASDSRAGGFVARHGRLIQVEVEALDPDVLRGLVQDAVAETWDDELEEEVLADEREQRQRLQAFVAEFGEDEE